MHYIIYLLLILSLFIGKHSLAQKNFALPEPEVLKVSRNGFTVNWNLNQPVKAMIKWKSLHSNENGTYVPQEIQQKFEWDFDWGKPGCFYGARLGVIFSDDTLYGPEYFFATQSLSKGEIKVFFNHPVNHDVSPGTKAVYLQGTITDTLIKYLSEAKETIDICVYNLLYSPALSGIVSALNEAAMRGVQVRIIYNAGSSNTMLSRLSPLIGKLPSKSGPDYSLMHNKFVIIDADAEDPDRAMVWTGSANWTEEQFSGPDKNNILVVKDQSVARAYKIEFEEMYGSAGLLPDLSRSRFGSEKKNNTPHIFSVGGIKVRVYFSPSDNTNAEILRVLNSAENDIAFASMVITRLDIADCIVTKLDQGLSAIYGIVEDTSGSYPTPLVWNKLSNSMLNGHMISHNGFPGVMHHKFLIADATHSLSDPQILTGSHNWTYAAQETNDENTLIIHDALVANNYYQAVSWLMSHHGGSLIGIESLPDATHFSIYPNPVRDYLKINRMGKEAGLHRIKISNMQGIMIREFRLMEQVNEVNLDLSDLQPGCYILQMEGKADFLFKIIKI